MRRLILCFIQIVLVFLGHTDTFVGENNNNEHVLMNQSIIDSHSTLSYHKKKVIIRPNANADSNSRVLTQDMISHYGPNTKFVIKYDLDLSGETIVLPKCCVLRFNGGSIRNGNIVFDNTKLKGAIRFKDCFLSGLLANDVIYTSWFDTDDFDSFSSLISYENKTIIIDGVYNVTRTIHLKSNTRILGVNKEAAVLKYNLNSEGYIFKTDIIYPTTYEEIVGKTIFGTSNIEIANITFDYNRGNIDTSVKEHWVDLYDCKNVRIKNIKFISTEEVLEYPKAIFVRECKNVQVDNCSSYVAPMLQMWCCIEMKANNNYGINQNSTFIELDAGFNGEIRGNKVYNWLGVNTYSIIGSNSSNITIENNYIESSSNNGYPLNLGHVADHLYAINNVVNNNSFIRGEAGLNIQAAENVIVKNNYSESITPVRCSRIRNSAIIEKNTFCIIKNDSQQKSSFSINLIAYDGIGFNNNTIISKTDTPYIISITSNNLQFNKNDLSTIDGAVIEIKGVNTEIKNNLTKHASIIK